MGWSRRVRSSPLHIYGTSLRRRFPKERFVDIFRQENAFINLARTLSISLALAYFASTTVHLRAFELALALVTCGEFIVAKIALRARATSVALRNAFVREQMER